MYICFCGCHNKLLQTWWLKTEIYLLQFWSIKSEISTTKWKWRCQQLHCPSKGSRENLPLTLSVPGSCQDSLACGCITSISASVFMWPCLLSLCLLSLTNTLVIGFRYPWVIQEDPILRSLTEVHLQRQTFLTRSHLVLGHGDILGHHSAHYSL